MFTSKAEAPFMTAGFARMIERAETIQAKLGFKVHPHMLKRAIRPPTRDTIRRPATVGATRSDIWRRSADPRQKHLVARPGPSLLHHRRSAAPRRLPGAVPIPATLR